MTKAVSYTHKGVEFQWCGGLNIYKPGELFPIRLQLNNNSPSWRLKRNAWLSVKQFKYILKNNI